ncbi:MAG: TetR family transcriptional regulator [Streptosporangiales bacterium]|nr:TetR family transcriptional regulator [Streptosporangiales bacterium]
MEVGVRETGADQRWTDPGPRARIRDAALRQFAAHGFKGATVRGIAQQAGVSPGLVQHHFPSKQALRDECDAYVFAVLRDVKDRGIGSGAVTDGAFMADTHQAVTPLVPYIAMAMVSDAPTASRWFDDLAALYRGVLTSGELGPALPESEDVPAIVAVHTAMQLGLAILARHVYRRLGTDERDPSTVARIGRARLFLAAERLIDEELEARIGAGLDRYEQTTTRPE